MLLLPSTIFASPRAQAYTLNMYMFDTHFYHFLYGIYRDLDVNGNLIEPLTRDKHISLWN